MSSQNETTLTTPSPTATTSLNITSITNPTTYITSIQNATTATTTTATATETSTNNGRIPDILKPNYPIAENVNNQSGLSTQLLICGGVGILLFLIFCFLRTRWTVIFAPRKNMRRQKPPKLPDTFFGWVIPLIRISQEQMIDKVGLDAVIMLDFIVMAIKIFGCCSFFGVIILIPISTTTGNFTDPAISPVDHMSMAVIEDSSPYLIPYLVFTYLFTFIAWFFLQQNYNSYIYKRANYILQRSSSLVCRSIIITGLPTYLRTDRDLAEYFEKYVGVGRVESCHINRHVHDLGKIIQKRSYYLSKLERYYAIYLGNPSLIKDYDPDQIMEESLQQLQRRSSVPQIHLEPSKDQDHQNNNNNNNQLNGNWDEFANEKPLTQRRNRIRSNNDTTNDGNKISGDPNLEQTVSNSTKQKTARTRPQVKTGFLGLWGEKVDAIDYYTQLFNEYDLKAIKARESPEFDMTNVGFVTFEDMSSALIASQITINPVPFRCRVNKAYEPRDVIWNNMHMNGKERIIRTILVWIITICLIIFWIFPVAILSSFTSLESIQRIAPGIGKWIDSSLFLKNIIQGLVPTILVNVVMALIPLITDYLGYVQGLRARSAITESTLSKYFFFLIFNVLLVFTLAGVAIPTFLSDVFNRPTEIPNILATKLPKIAPFFVNYTIMQGFLLMPLNLLLLGPLIIRGFSIYFLFKSPREHATARAPDGFNYGIGYPAPLLIFVIVLEYSLISPIILVFGVVYFCITFLVYKYQFLYVYFRNYEAAGELWTMVFPRIIAGMIIFHLTMLGLFILKGSWILGILCIPLIFFTLVFKFTMDAAYKENSVFIAMQLVRQYEENKSSSITLIDSSETNELQADGSQDRDNNNKDPVLPTSTPHTSGNKMGHIQNKWLTALKTIQENARTTLSNSAPKKVLKRRKTVALDEDNYKAVPDLKTDYRQPPMSLNPGVLDTGLKNYGSPYIIGSLPQLWLPTKWNINNNDNSNHEKKPKRPTSHFRRRSSLIPNQELDYNGNTVQSTSSVSNIAKIIRLMNKTESNPSIEQTSRPQPQPQQQHTSNEQLQQHQQPNSDNNINKSDSVSFLGRIGRILSNTTSEHGNDSDSSSDEDSDSDSDSDSDNDNGNESISPFHRTYYHHPSTILNRLRHTSSSSPPQRSPLHLVNSAPSILQLGNDIHNNNSNNNNSKQ